MSSTQLLVLLICCVSHAMSEMPTKAEAEAKPKYTVQLDGSCKLNDDCAAAFSGCTKNKCECSPGTKKSGKLCIPDARHCAFGEPLTEAGKLVVCDPSSFGRFPILYNEGIASAAGEKLGMAPNGTCPTNHVCISEGQVSYGAVKGFCCPVPNDCPIGKPDHNKTCSYSDNSNGLEYCPYETHYCYSAIAGVSSEGQVCCQKPCPNGAVYKDGTCLRPADVGEACESNEVCEPSSAECGSSGKCECGKEKVLSPVSGVCTYPYCSYTNESLQPLKNEKDEYIICPTKKCPAGHYCAYDNNVCCPIPSPYCNDNKVLEAKDVHTCSFPLIPDDNKPTGECPDGKNCITLYREINPNATSFKETGTLPELMHGLCC